MGVDVSLSTPINPLPWMRPTKRGRKGSPPQRGAEWYPRQCVAASGWHRSPVAPLLWAPREAHRVRVPRRRGACRAVPRVGLLGEGSGPPVRARGRQCGAGGRRAGRERGAVPCRAVPGRGRPCPLGGGGAPSCCAVPPAGGSALGRPALAASGGAARGGAARAAAAAGPGPGPEAPWPAEGRLLARPAPPRAALRGARHGCATAPPPGPLRRRRCSTGSARFPARRCPAGRRR